MKIVWSQNPEALGKQVPGGIRRTKPFVTLALLLMLTTPAWASVNPVVGSSLLIGKDGDGAFCAETREKLQAAYDAAEKHDIDGVQEALQGGTQLTRGEQVLIIDNAIGSGFMEGIDVRVRILSGSDAHLACWAWEKTMHLQPMP